MAPRRVKVPMNFKAMAQADVPQGRNGKHKEIVTKILSDLDRVPKGVSTARAETAPSVSGARKAKQ